MTTWNTILCALGVAVSGDPEQGRRALTDCWEGTAESDHAQRSVIAHYLADLQDHLDEEVTWNEQALAAFRQVPGEDLTPAAGIALAAAFAPSLHLNLGDGYLRQGRVEDARTHLEAGLADPQVLSEDGYGDRVRDGLESLRLRIDDAQAARTR